MNEFEIIFADPSTAAAYMFSSAICVAILFAWGALCLARPGRRRTPALRPVLEGR